MNDFLLQDYLENDIVHLFKPLVLKNLVIQITLIKLGEKRKKKKKKDDGAEPQRSLL